MTPKLTIIMSTYNDEKYIRQALESILMQTLTEWELIIINDNSTDKTESIILELFKNDKRLKFIKNEKQMGVTLNTIHCMELAKTELVARLDGDDYWLDDKKLERQYKMMSEDESIGILGTWAKVVNLSGKELYTIEYPLSDDVMRPNILHENFFVTSSIVFRKLPQDEVKRLSPLNKYADDFNLVLQLGIDKRFSNLNEYCTAYRINPQGISQTKAKMQIDDTLRIITQYKSSYPGYYFSYFLWTMRKHYPIWLKGKFSMAIKKNLRFY